MLKKKSKKARKPVFRKVKLPTDRYGNPVSPGDFMAFDEGIFCIRSLTLYEFGEWVASGNRVYDENGDWVDDADIDNISGGRVIYKL